MRILGIDPGYATVGYGVIEYQRGKFQVLDYGAVTTPAGLDFSTRLQIIYEGICELCDRFKPDCMSVEELFFNTNITTGIQVGHARGVIMLAGHQKGVEFNEYTPLQVKQSVVGYGRAEKRQVIALVKTILGFEETRNLKLDDTADALALAICHAHTGSSRIQDFYNQKKKKLL